MAEPNLSFAKIVANPTAFSWSQVYSAGKLFAVLSLETQEEIGEKDYLNVLGKEIFDTLEQEFFTLEEKDLESIKVAVEATSKKIPQDVNCSFVIGSIVNNILYLYVLGNGRVSLKREEKLGNLMEIQDQKPDSLKVASGFLQDNDLVILQTKQFSDIISVGTLSEFMDNLSPTDAAENIAPLVHEKGEAGAAAIIISFKAPVAREETLPPAEENKIEEEKIQSQEAEETAPLGGETRAESPFYSPQVKISPKLSDRVRPFVSSLYSRFRVSERPGLNHSKKVILTIVIIILVVFVGSVVFAINKQKNEKIQATFQNIYSQAQKKYQEGESLLSLNQGLARDSLTSAQQILNSGKGQLPVNSSQEKQILDLLAKVNSVLSSTSGVNAIQAKQVDTSVSGILAAETKNDGLYFTQDSKNIYGITNSQVFSLALDGTNKKTIINNSGDWQSVGGLSNYFGNIYILDKKQNTILKYVPSDSGYSKTNYFSANTAPDLSNAVSMAIDSSVYVLSGNTVAKFTRGSAVNFSLSGLDKPLSGPTSILTSADDTYIYILDNGNSRIVVFDKTGAYKNQYQSGVIKNAKDFDVSESDKKMYVLSQGKVYEIDLK